MIKEYYSGSELEKRFPSTTFGENVTIGRGAILGKNTLIASGVRIYPGTVVEDNVQVLENTVLGRATIVPKTSSVKRKLSCEIGSLVVRSGSVIGCNSVLYRGTIIGEDSIICDLSSIREHCVLGRNTLIGRGVMIQVNTKIGSRTKIMDSCHLPGDMTVGEDVFISTHVCGASENSLGRTTGNSDSGWRGPIIKDRAYIGLNATLLPGITIGEDSVVAAHSVVTKDVSKRTLVMGSPARIKNEVGTRS